MNTKRLIHDKIRDAVVAGQYATHWDDVPSIVDRPVDMRRSAILAYQTDARFHAQVDRQVSMLLFGLEAWIDNYTDLVNCTRSDLVVSRTKKASTNEKP